MNKLNLYSMMLKSRFFEQIVIELWYKGLISGEMHLGIGEEAISAGVIAHLEEGDALALDHRATPQMIMRGLQPESILLEFLGHADGICGGMAGHMHIYSKDHLLACSGIVGSSGPAAVGFATANQTIRPKKVAIAFFGEGAMNQGMLLESLNLASVWKLPVIFICKDNQFSITTESKSVTAGDLLKRVESFEILSRKVDGHNVVDVFNVAEQMFNHTRNGNGPSFLLCSCYRPEGHFLGDPFVNIARHPMKELSSRTLPLISSLLKRKGAVFKDRLNGIANLLRSAYKTQLTDQQAQAVDPIICLRNQLIDQTDSLERITKEVSKNINQALNYSLEKIPESIRSRYA